MKNTYLNDGMTSPYPFMEGGDGIPFPYSCVAGMGVSLAVPPEVADLAHIGSQGAFGGIRVTAAELTEDNMTITLAAEFGSLDSPLELGSVQASRDQSYGATSARIRTALSDHPVLFSAWLCRGVVPAPAYGSYVCSALLDPSCVTLMQNSDAGYADKLKVNDIETDMPECLNLATDGYLRLDLCRPSDVLVISQETLGHVPLSTFLPDSGYQAAVMWTDIPDDAPTTVSDTVNEYQKVLSVNGTAFRVSDQGCATMHIEFAPPPDRPESHSSAYITCSLENAVLTDDISVMYPYGCLERTGSGYERTGWPQRFNDDIGDAVILTVEGHKAFPNCYKASEDEAPA